LVRIRDTLSLDESQASPAAVEAVNGTAKAEVEGSLERLAFDDGRDLAGLSERNAWRCADDGPSPDWTCICLKPESKGTADGSERGGIWPLRYSSFVGAGAWPRPRQQNRLQRVDHGPRGGRSGDDGHDLIAIH